MLGINNKCLFLDRDGVIIKDKNYISSSLEVELEKGAKYLINLAKKNHYLVVIITNQSGISRGYFNWNQYEEVTKEMIQQLGGEMMVDGIYANGISPDESTKADSWRKPGIGMIMQAKNDFNIVLKDSILIGDRLSDILSGLRAGLGHLIHVETGHGHKERSKVEKYLVRETPNMTCFEEDGTKTNFTRLTSLEEFDKEDISIFSST